ncbi:MAG: hypothetical protein HZB62_13170 [Nitrospirae bacterium]|nr:hypothetical protein [Nitrospirota bacterium]
MYSQWAEKQSQFYRKEALKRILGNIERDDLTIAPIFIDVEGLPDRDSYYLIGVRFKTSEGIIQHSLWADKVIIWRDFLCILSRIENPVLIHYGSFETTLIKRMCDRYGGSTEDSAVAKAITSTVNVLSVEPAL